jgi:hypothetical protein
VSIIAYSCLFASLLAAGGVVVYKNYTGTELEKEVVLLDAEVNTFSVQDFRRVQDFNEQLQLTSERVRHTVSTVALLDELDQIVAQPIQIKDLNIERNSDENLQLAVNFTTQTLDAALFQRKLLTANTQLFAGVEISEINLTETGQDDASGETAMVSAVNFRAEFSAPVDLATFDPAEARRTNVGTSISKGLETTPIPLQTPPAEIEQSGQSAETELLEESQGLINTATDNETAL